MTPNAELGRGGYCDPSNEDSDMALILQVTVINDKTGEVEKTYVETVDDRTDSWEAAKLLRRFLARMFEIAYPGSHEW